MFSEVTDRQLFHMKHMSVCIWPAHAYMRCGLKKACRGDGQRHFENEALEHECVVYIVIFELFLCELYFLYDIVLLDVRLSLCYHRIHARIRQKRALSSLAGIRRKQAYSSIGWS